MKTFAKEMTLKETSAHQIKYTNDNLTWKVDAFAEFQGTLPSSIIHIVNKKKYCLENTRSQIKKKIKARNFCA